MDNIPEKILLAAAKCPNEFACLKNDGGEAHNRCRVKYPNGENVLFLAGEDQKDCPLPAGFCQQLCLPVPGALLFASEGLRV